MRITIDDDVARDASACPWLDRILATVEDGWHLWDVSGLEAYEGTPWFEDAGRAGGRVRELYRQAVARSAYPARLHGRAIRVAKGISGPDVLSAERAARFASEPLVLLVENRESDGAFVLRVACELDGALRSWWQQTTAPVTLESMGGKGQMITVVRRALSASESRPRLVVVVDSDRRAPRLDASREERKLRKFCDDHGVPCWVLAKRESENYLVEALLDARPDADAEHRRRIECWGRMSPEQKDFYDMKAGLPGGPNADEDDLFGDLAPGSRSTLSKGFGSNVYKCWDVWERVPPLRPLLEQRGGGDLEYGLDLIRGEV